MGSISKFPFIGNIKIKWIYGIIYTCFFLSGLTSLIFEVLWSRQFVTVFGNSAYAISTVLCAYMAGLGVGSLFGGRLADRVKKRAVLYGLIIAAVAIWAILIPPVLNLLRTLIASLPLLFINSLLLNTLIRFFLSFIILGIPCFLLGVTMPLLVRTVTKSDDGIGLHIGMLYCLNTLGAALGCLAAGFWMIDTLGLKNTNLLTVGINIIVAIVIIAFSNPAERISTSEIIKPDLKNSNISGNSEQVIEHGIPDWLLLAVSFFNGFIGLACEVLWMRYIAFIDNVAYVFPTILCVYLLGIGLGGLLYSLLAKHIRQKVKILGIIEILLSLSILATFVVSALIFTLGPPHPIELKGMTIITVFVPTLLMGFAFPLLCTVYGTHVQKLGSKIGKIYAINTIGTVIGSLLPMFVLIPLMGIQKSLLLVSILSGIVGLSLFAFNIKKNNRPAMQLTITYAILLILYFFVIPSNLCQRVFRATNFDLGKQADILYYHEGQTGTSIVTQDRLNKCKTIYINGVSEVPALYSHQLCFKLIGDLGPILHPNPNEVLMICFGGGIAAGSTAILPQVKHLTVVDIESSVIKSAQFLSTENNNLLKNRKVAVVIDDGRNYLLMGRHKWPVIISDSTHPKSSDSWVLYTQEFYQMVRDRLTDDGIFVEWVPMHELKTAEFKIIVRTFQSVFPHTSLWITQGTDEKGDYAYYSLLAATSKPLKIDANKLKEKLNEKMTQNDLKPYDLNTPSGFLSTFLSAGETLKNWVGNGPVNTDDLPYTQYKTKYTNGNSIEAAELIEPMENIFPYLVNIGSEQAANQLKDELMLQYKVNRLSLLGALNYAYSIMPDNIRYNKMKKLYNDGINYNGELAKIYWNDPKALVYLATSMANGAGGLQATIPLYERVLEINPKDISALNVLGGNYLDEKNYKMAEKYLSQAVSLSPGFAAARFNLGLVQDKTGRHIEALKNWYKAALDPEFDRASNMVGLCVAGEGRLPEAIPWFRRALKINPISIENRLNLAFGLFQTGSKNEALYHLQYVLKLDPDNENALDMLAMMNGQEKFNNNQTSGKNNR